MCGIAGSLSSVASTRIVQWMLNVEAHRGPDGEGLWSRAISDNRHLILGHRRLSIIDLTDTGAQPMIDCSGRYVITYNGEIYNYLEVRAELQRAGDQFHSTSDTEVILKAYARWGMGCLSRFNGMFAFALYDQVRGVLFCARDRYGEKPFLYSPGDGFFAFASEYKALLLHPGVDDDIDEWRLIRAANNPSSGLDADRQTVFRGIQQLLPGEAMEVDVQTLRSKVWRYWKIEPSALRESVDERDVFAEFRELLIDSVKLRLRSDVTVGSCLSGGLDSSAIVCIVRNLLGEGVPYHTFTGRFPGTAADEWKYAEEVISATGVVAHTVEPTVERFLDELPEFVWYNELPVGSSSQFAQWCVFKLAKEQDVTVLLDGQGADEALGGYEQYFARYVEALQQRGDSARLGREIPMIRERYPLALKRPVHSMRDRLPFAMRHWISNRWGFGTNLLYGLRVDAARRVTEENALPMIPDFDPLANALVQDSFGRFLTTLLRYGDRNSMAHSREVRLPFCDHRIAEFVFRLPPHLLMGEVQTKRLIRESMRGILPEPIRVRWNKQGFRPPQDLWFRSPRMLARVRDTLSSAAFRDSPYWIPRWWQQALGRVESGEVGLSWAVWNPFILEQWRQHFLNRVRDLRTAAGEAPA
jgi:asparagine synthase (glutamine-hydrolysing)